MTTGFANQPAPAIATTATTYNGFYLRNNLSSLGNLPAVSPFNLTPDIIQSSQPVANPQVSFSTMDSWQTLYPTAPEPGKNYYYVRGANGGSNAFSGQMRLYWAPSQLIMFPSCWKNNPLSTSSGLEDVNVQAEVGHIGVGDGAFVLNKGSQALSIPDSFYAFVAQNTVAAIPTISSWLEMSQLMTQQLGFGFRNMVSFDPVDGPMLYRLGLNIPMSIGESATLQLTLSVQGIPQGDTIGLVGDCYTPEMKPIEISPITTTTSSYLAGIQVNLDPGFNSSIAVQYWNTSGQVPAPGSLFTLTANYVVPPDKYDRALMLGVLDSSYAQPAAPYLGVPQQVCPVGSVSFVVASSI